MRLLLALLACAGGGFALIVALRARSLKRRHRAVLGAELPRFDEGAGRLVDAPRALYHGTCFADGTRLLDESLGSECVGDLICTAEAVLVRREEGGPAGGKLVALPMAWIEDASLLRAHAALAGRELPTLRLRWRRGGQLLQTDVSLRGGLPQLEKLRREIHLRQGQGGALHVLERFLQPPGGVSGPQSGQ